MVSKNSDFGDAIWDVSTEVHTPSFDKEKSRLRFTGVWSRQPELTHTVKHYLLIKRKNGCTWSTVRSTLFHLRRCAQWLESNEFTRWDQLSLEDWRRCYVATIMTNKCEYQIAREIVNMGKLQLPMGPCENPFAGISIRFRDKSKRTRPISSDALKQFASVFVYYEKNALKLMECVQQLSTAGTSYKWDGAVCGIRGWQDVMREMRFARFAAACILMLSCGVRFSELLSLQRGCLYFDQGVNLWFVRGTVYKFHGDGVPARWLCGEMGRRAVQLLETLWVSGSLFSSWSGRPYGSCDLTHHFRQFVVRHDIREDGTPMNLHAHRFRKSFVQEVFKTGTVGLMPLMEQMKHRSPTMTDRYVDNCIILHDQLERELGCPLGEFQQNLAKALKI